MSSLTGPAARIVGAEAATETPIASTPAVSPPHGVPAGADAAAGARAAGADPAAVASKYHIKGHVQDKNGAPLVGHFVMAYTTTQHYVTGATTNASGDYSLTVAAGSYFLYEINSSPDFAGGCWHGTEPTGDWSTCTTYKVTTADITVNMTVPPTPTLSGQVFDATTAAGLGQVITLVEPFGGTTQWSGGTAMDGTFHIAMQPGIYLIELTGDLTGWWGRNGWSPNQSDAVPITLPASGITGLTLPVPARGWLNGTVSGTDCNPVASWIDVYSAEGFVAETMVNYGGAFSVAVPVGDLWVQYWDGNGTCGVGWYSGNGLDAVADSNLAAAVTVTASTPGVVNMTVSSPRWITGKILSASGAGVSTRIQVWAGSDFYLQTVSASNGAFWLPVVAGSYRLFVVGKSTSAFGWYSRGSLSYSEGAASTVDVTSADKGVTIKAPKALDLVVGTVKSGGKPRKGVTVVALSGKDVAAWATTDVSGYYMLRLRAGSYTLVEEGADDLLGGVYATGGFSPYTADAKKVTASATRATASFVVPAGRRVHGIARTVGAVGTTGVLAELFDARGLYDLVPTGFGGIFDHLLPAHEFRLGFYDPNDVWGTAWYSDGGPVRDEVNATTLALAAGDRANLAITLPPITAPDAPTGVTGAPYDTGVVVTWTEPVNDGWRPITGHTVTAQPGGATCAAAAFDSRCVVKNLDNGTPYTFTVVATNLKGDSAASTASAPATPGNLPAPPDPVLASGFHNGALVSWASSPTATGYAVTSSPAGFGCTTAGETSCSITGLNDGVEYAFTVVASNGNGDGPASAESSPVIPSLPTAKMTALPATSAVASLLVMWASPGSDNPATYDVRSRRAPYNGKLGAYTPVVTGTADQGTTVPVLAGSTYCYSVLAHDLGTTATAWSAETCTAVPIDDRGLTRSAGWTLQSNASDYLGTNLRATKLGATLTRTKVVAKTLTLVATTCKGCGTVKVYLGSTLLKTISLASSTTMYRKVFTIATFSAAKTGTISIKVATSGKAVLIDGLGVKRQ
jgi:hypothetical protein